MPLKGGCRYSAPFGLLRGQRHAFPIPFRAKTKGGKFLVGKRRRQRDEHGLPRFCHDNSIQGVGLPLNSRHGFRRFLNGCAARLFYRRRAERTKLNAAFLRMLRKGAASRHKLKASGGTFRFRRSGRSLGGAPPLLPLLAARGSTFHSKNRWPGFARAVGARILFALESETWVSLGFADFLELFLRWRLLRHGFCCWMHFPNSAWQR